jgi:hypothetical protein
VVQQELSQGKKALKPGMTLQEETEPEETELEETEPAETWQEESSLAAAETALIRGKAFLDAKRRETKACKGRTKDWQGPKRDQKAVQSLFQADSQSQRRRCQSHSPEIQLAEAGKLRNQLHHTGCW